MLTTPLGNNVFKIEYRGFSLIFTGEMTTDIQKFHGISVQDFIANAIDRLILNRIAPCPLRLRISSSDGSQDDVLLSIRIDVMKDF